MSVLSFQQFTGNSARDVRDEVEDIYRRSYSEIIDSGSAFDTVEAFIERFDAYTDPQRGEFTMVMARVDGEPAGQAWGWPLSSATRWWEGLRLDIDDPDFTSEDGTRTFALSEIMVCSEHTGKGLAHALHDELLKGRPEHRATLLVEPDNERAYAAYSRWGWQRVGTLQPDWEDAPMFEVLVRDLQST